MSYYIAKTITITPQSIHYVGHDNNVDPACDRDFEEPLTWQNLYFLVLDLLDGRIEPKQLWWQRITKEISKRYDSADLELHEDCAEDAMQFVISCYNIKLIENKQLYPQIKLELLTMPK